ASSPDIVMEESPDVEETPSGEAASSSVVEVEETTEKQRVQGTDVELEEEEQQEEVDYGTDAVMESTEVVVQDAAEEKASEETVEVHEETKPRGFVEEADCEPVEVEERLTTECVFGPLDATLDTTFDRTGGLIGSYSTEGFQYLLSGVRANVGAKPGSKHNFVFEVRLVEVLTPLDAQSSSHAHLPAKKHALRVGFGTLDAGVILGAHEATVCFDSDGGIWEGKHRHG
ncbi:hypothetical protein FOZ63_012513, partial [Perkinsus olseni]